MGTAVDRAHEYLYARIADGRLNPGERLYEEDIADATGVSRTPVREALRRLAADGLVTLAGKRGAQVTTWSTDDLESVFDMRTMLEPYAAARAAERITDAQLARLRHLDEQMHAAAAREAYREIAPLNNAFHFAVAEAAMAPKLDVALRPLIHVPLVPRSESYSATATAASLDQHRQLIQALEAHDVPRASTIMRDHILHAREALLRILGSPPTPSALELLMGATS